MTTRQLRCSIGGFTTSVVFSADSDFAWSEEMFERLKENLSFELEASSGEKFDEQFDERIEIHLKSVDHTSTPSWQIILPIFKRDRRVFLTARGRRVEFSDGSVINLDRTLRRAIVSSHFPWSDICEVLESWIGLRVEARGIVRYHAVAFVADVNRSANNFLVVAGSGFGKSTFAEKNLENTLADEVCYLAGDKLQNACLKIRIKSPEGNWPTRHGCRTLVTRPINFTSRIIENVYFGTNQNRRLIKLRWIINVFFGIGLPQFIEYSVWSSTIPTWFRIAVNRGRSLSELNSKFRGRVSRESLNQFVIGRK